MCVPTPKFSELLAQLTHRLPECRQMKWPISPTPLAGEIVVLKPLAREHLEELFEAARPPEIWQWWPFNPAVDKERFAQWLTEALTAAETGTALHFVTLDATTGRAIGSTSYCTPRPDHGGLEIGWTWLTPSAWRTGANAEAKLLQLTHAFERLGCHRVEFETDERNERSRRALMALPAHFEGVLRDWKVLPTGRWRSSAIFSILRREWPTTQANLTRRVSQALTRRDTHPAARSHEAVRVGRDSVVDRPVPPVS